MNYLKVGGIAIVSILFVSVFTALFFVQPTGMGSAQLTPTQTQFYWKCFADNKCGELLKSKAYTAYRTCSLECVNQALKPVNYFCTDADGTDYLTKSKVVSNLYPQGKEDYCQTFPSGKTYLMEGICKDNKYAYVQKGCAELGSNYQCKNGGCTDLSSSKCVDNMANINSIQELPLNETELQYFFEVLLNPNVADEIMMIREVTRWDRKDCIIPIYFEAGWNTRGGQKIKQLVEQDIPILTGNLYTAVFINSDPSLLNKYKNDQRITIHFLSGTTGKANTKASITVGTWKGLEVLKGEEITSGEITLPSEWMNNVSLITSKDYDNERTVVHELGHALGYGHSWQIDSFISQSTVGPNSKKPVDWEVNLFNIFYRLPIGTSPETIYNSLNLEEKGIDVVDALPLIIETREGGSGADDIWPGITKKTSFNAGEIMHIIGRKLTSARYCASGYEWESNIPQNSPIVYIGDTAIPIVLPLMIPASWDPSTSIVRGAMCQELPVKIPENIPSGNYNLRIFVRNKWSNNYTININNPAFQKKGDGEQCTNNLDCISNVCCSGSACNNMYLPKFPKTDTPVVKLFLASFCPYGKKAEAALKPVANLLKDSFELEPQFIIWKNFCGWNVNSTAGIVKCKANATQIQAGYKEDATKKADYCFDADKEIPLYCSMHGITELREDIRQAIILKYFKDKWWDYVTYVNNNTIMDNIEIKWKKAAQIAGLDVNKIQEYFDKESLDILKNEAALNAQFGAYSSPTIFINDNYLDYPNYNPAMFKTGVCSAFNTQPVECNKGICGIS